MVMAAVRLDGLIEIVVPTLKVSFEYPSRVILVAEYAQVSLRNLYAASTETNG
jgi:hypothetical protein